VDLIILILLALVIFCLSSKNERRKWLWMKKNMKKVILRKM
jgi:hypothetical protein